MDIGIIGGADGPTTIFIASDFSLYIIYAVVFICTAAVGTTVWLARRKKNRH